MITHRPSRCRQADGDNWRAYNNLGAALYNSGQHAAAIAAATHAVKGNPKYVAARSNLASMLQAAGRLDEALKYAREATKLNPGGAEQWYTQGEVERVLQQFESALASADKAIRTSPHLSRAHVLKGLVYTALHRHKEAIAPFREALRLTPSADLYADLGTVYSVLADTARSRKALVAALRLDPNSARAYAMMGRSYLPEKEYFTAFPYLAKSVEINPKGIPAYNNLGVCYEKTGHIDEALEMYGIAVSLQPNLVETYNNIAHLYTMKEDPPNSIKTYLVALRLEPTRAMTYYNLGTAYAENGDFREQERAMRACMAIFLAKWNQVRATAECPGGKRRLVFHWEGEKGVRVQTVELPSHEVGLSYGAEKPSQPLSMGPYSPFDSLRFTERRIIYAVVKDIIVEGRDSILHDHCRVPSLPPFLPSFPQPSLVPHPRGCCLCCCSGVVADPRPVRPSPRSDDPSRGGRGDLCR